MTSGIHRRTERSFFHRTAPRATTPAALIVAKTPLKPNGRRTKTSRTPRRRSATDAQPTHDLGIPKNARLVADWSASSGTATAPQDDRHPALRDDSPSVTGILQAAQDRRRRCWFQRTRWHEAPEARKALCASCRQKRCRGPAPARRATTSPILSHSVRRAHGLGACPERSARTDAPMDASPPRPLPGSPRSSATRESSRDCLARSPNARHARPFRERP